VLKKRFEKVKDIAAIKEREGLSIFQMDRWMKLVQEQTALAESKGLSPEFIHELFALVHKYSVDFQTSLIKKE
jgi:chorismate mutase